MGCRRQAAGAGAPRRPRRGLRAGIVLDRDLAPSSSFSTTKKRRRLCGRRRQQVPPLYPL